MRTKFSIIVIVSIVTPISALYFLDYPKPLFSGKFPKIIAQELRFEFSFPKEDEKILLAYPTTMDVDEEGNIYICDYQQSCIIKYTRKGKLIKTIGRKGKGPGEFTNQSVFDYDDGRLFIADMGRLQILDKEGNYLSSFKTFRGFSALGHFKDRIFSYLIYLTAPKGSKEFHLISTFNESGRLIGGFGKYLDFVDNMPLLASDCLLQIYDSRLYVLFRCYPILRVYSLVGELLYTIEFDQLDYTSLVPNNYKVKTKIQSDGTQIIPLRALFRAFDVTEDGIFVGLYDPDIIIDSFDFNGKFIQRFRRQHKTEKFYLFDFKVFKKNENELEFYILNEEEVPKVDVCTARIKNSSQ